MVLDAQKPHDTTRMQRTEPMQESQHTEFKRQWKDALLKWGSAFANALYRQECYPMPMAALRERILNAVVHKDYASAIAIQISVYPRQADDMEPRTAAGEMDVGRSDE